MANSAHAYPARFLCPLVNREIGFMGCIVVQDASEKLLKAEVVLEEFTHLDNWREICKACKYHENS